MKNQILKIAFFVSIFGMTASALAGSCKPTPQAPPGFGPVCTELGKKGAQHCKDFGWGNCKWVLTCTPKHPYATAAACQLVYEQYGVTDSVDCRCQ